MLSFVWIILMLLNSWQNEVQAPPQAAEGPGGANYLHAAVTFHDFADQADGFWLFEPAAPRPDSAGLVVFVHGYGAINPMIYGAWIRHIVRKGNVVIFPRYQKNLFNPSAHHFVPNVARAVKDAITTIDTSNLVKSRTDQMVWVGHSYGGAISANVAARADSLGLPNPVAMLLCSPGTGPFKGGLLDSYEDISDDLKLLIMVSEHDRTVGDKLGTKIFETAINSPQRNLIRQRADGHGKPPMTAGHNECYSLDKAFDSGLDNISTRRALRIGQQDIVDHFGYWKLLDALINCSRQGSQCAYAFGNTDEQRSMGYWSDGQAVKELDVIVAKEPMQGGK